MLLIKNSRAVLVLVMASLLLASLPAAAYDRTALEQRRAERRAELEARRAERAAERTAREANEVAIEVEESCRCRASLSFSKPSLQWRGGQLVFTPRVNISIRSRGEERMAWTARLDLAGTSAYESTDREVPVGAAFGGSYELFSGQCGDTYSFNGWQLPAVVLGGLPKDLAKGEEVDGRVQMNARVYGCGEDEEKRAFNFTLMDFGNLRVRGWRSVR